MKEGQWYYYVFTAKSNHCHVTYPQGKLNILAFAAATDLIYCTHRRIVPPGTKQCYHSFNIVELINSHFVGEDDKLC